MFEVILNLVVIMIAISLVVLLIRVIIGPTISDRLLALDSFGVTLVALIGIVMILHDTIYYSDIVLALSIILFISTVAIAKFIERGDIIDRD